MTQSLISNHHREVERKASQILPHPLEGGIDSLTPDKETAEGIVEMLQTFPLDKARFFWPHSALSRPILPDFFKSQDISYVDCVLYDTEFQQPTPLPDFDKIDEITFTSPSTVDAFFHFFGRSLPKKRFNTIGPITAGHLSALRTQSMSASNIKDNWKTTLKDPKVPSSQDQERFQPPDHSTEDMLGEDVLLNLSRIYPEQNFHFKSGELFIRPRIPHSSL